MTGFEREGKMQRYLSKYNINSDCLNPQGIKSILKVQTIEESLRSCSSPNGCQSNSLRQLGKNIRDLGARSARSLKSTVTSTRHIKTTDSANEAGPLDLVDASDVDMNQRSTTRTTLLLVAAADDTAHTEASTMDTTCGTSRIRSTVRFGDIHSRAYRLQVGDNPSVSKGAAVHLSWNYHAEPTVTVESHQEFRAQHPPLPIHDLKLSVAERERMLMQSGASRHELAMFSRRIKRAKARRAETVHALICFGQDVMRREEEMENTVHFIKRMVGLRRSDTNEQKRLWKRAQNRTNSSSLHNGSKHVREQQPQRPSLVR